ncbi:MULTISPECIES: hypothetical protein [Desulfofundulus]|uniref:hypothetical protein n=1 Tax=Desulfofundulus TaxID=2282741 RepID=UPI000F651C3E|nr:MULTISPECIES: hypothetical protein [Desulfofundulus]NHM26954.1 hypothetical protein [Desulfofundulus sp. TPOSR]
MKEHHVPQGTKNPEKHDYKPLRNEKKLYSCFPERELLRAGLRCAPAVTCRHVLVVGFSCVSIVAVTACSGFFTAFLLQGITSIAMWVGLFFSFFAIFLLIWKLVNCYFLARSVQVTPMIYALRKKDAWELHMSPLAYRVYESTKDPSVSIKYELATAAFLVSKNSDEAGVKVKFQTWLFRDGQIPGTGISGVPVRTIRRTVLAVTTLLLSTKTGKNLLERKPPDFRVLFAKYYAFSLTPDDVLALVNSVRELRPGAVETNAQAE